jgi:hypothetical protein
MRDSVPFSRLLLHGFLVLIGALVVAYAANWLLGMLHLDPFGIREMEW